MRLSDKVFMFCFKLNKMISRKIDEESRPKKKSLLYLYQGVVKSIMYFTV